MTGIRDALMFREVEDGTVWDVIHIPAARIEQLEAQGWIVLIAAGPRTHDVQDTYAADVNRFNPPRRG
jgi:hypothetical protein